LNLMAPLRVPGYARRCRKLIHDAMTDKKIHNAMTDKNIHKGTTDKELHDAMPDQEIHAGRANKKIRNRVDGEDSEEICWVG